MKSKRLPSLLLACAILSGGVLAGCSGGQTNKSTSSTVTKSSASSETESSEKKSTLPEDGGFKTVSYELSKDKYRTYYEIFPYSFYDSNDDGIGDLKGITSKLDYLNDGDTKTTDDLGVEGIWLMPIMESESYHKYDVIDYKSVDHRYGTIEDFENLTKEAHKRNINVIIDFVINHSSTSCEWFQKAKAELKAGKTDGYVQYYNFAKNKDDSKGWHTAGVGDWYYECEFWEGMPDLNLKNEKLQKELIDAAKFWIGKGVDGFRLDAVLWFEKTWADGADNDASVKELKWFYDAVKKEKDDIYMVGECWENSAIISKFYESGIDSLFDFGSEGSQGRVYRSLNSNDAKGYVEDIADWQEEILGKNPKAINTPFLSNHDTARSAGFFMTDTARKMAAAMYILSPGNAFVYYGEEIGMTGSGDDPNKRTGMYWSATDKKGYVPSIPGSKNKDVPDKAADEQIKDENSLQTFYRRVIALKNQNPEIARGKATALTIKDQDETAGYICDYNNSKVLVMFNLSDKAKELTIPSDKFKVSEARGYVIADSGDSDPSGGNTVDDILGRGSSKSSGDEKETIKDFDLDGQKLVMPAYSAIVLK